MRKSTASLLATAIFATMATPLYARSEIGNSSSITVANRDARSASRDAYVIQSNERALATLHSVSANGRPLRHVLLTGAAPMSMIDDTARVADASTPGH